MARCHQNHTLVDLAYLHQPLYEDKATINNTFIGRSLQGSDAGLTIQNNSS